MNITPGRRQSKTSILLTNADQKLLETEFLIFICRPTGDKWQSKTLFLEIFDPHLSIVKSVFDCCLPGVNILNKEFLSWTRPMYKYIQSVLIFSYCCQYNQFK